MPKTAETPEQMRERLFEKLERIGQGLDNITIMLEQFMEKAIALEMILDTVMRHYPPQTHGDKFMGALRDVADILRFSKKKD